MKIELIDVVGLMKQVYAGLSLKMVGAVMFLTFSIKYLIYFIKYFSLIYFNLFSNLSNDAIKGLFLHPSVIGMMRKMPINKYQCAKFRTKGRV